MMLYMILMIWDHIPLSLSMTSTFYHINEAHLLLFFKNTPPKLVKMACNELASDFLPHLHSFIFYYEKH